MVYNATAFQNLTDLGQVYQATATNVPGLFPFVLLCEFFVILIAGVSANKSKVGFTNVIPWVAVASVITTFSAFMYSLVTGIISLPILITCVAITSGSLLWLLLSNIE